MSSTVRRALRDLATAARDEKPTVFLSHSHADKEIVRKVADLLQASGVRVWIDETELKTGDSLVRKIEHGLDSSDYVAFFISSNSLRSSWAQQELNVAMSRQLSGQRQAVLLPVLLEDVEIPPLLRDVVYLDLRDGDVGRAARQLVETIHQGQIRERTVEPWGLPRGAGSIRAYIQIELSDAGGIDQVERSLKEIPEVVEVTRTFGFKDLMVVLTVKNLQRIHAIVQHMRKIPDIVNTLTQIGTL